MTRLLIAALATACLLPAVTLAAADPKVVESCNDCHGDKGVSAAQDVPTIAGVSEPVAADSMKAYKGKTRVCAKVNYKRGDTKRQGDMCTAAKDLTDAAIADLAAYYAKLPYVAQKQTTDPAKVAAGKVVHDRDCKKCHSKNGADPSDDAGILAGQPLAWMKSAMNAFRTGASEQEKKMKAVTTKLSEADAEALAHFYASQH